MTLDLDQWTEGRCTERKIQEFQKKCGYDPYKTRQGVLPLPGAFGLSNDAGS